jgi:hypothetical protein
MKGNREWFIHREIEMTSRSYDALRIRKVTPRTIQIMDRVMMGETAGQIAKAMGLTSGRVSIITNSPLFKIELRKKLLKNSQKITELRDTLLDGAIDGLKLHKEVLRDETPGVRYPMESRLRSGSVLAGLGLKMLEKTLQVAQPQNGSGEKLTYEERLKEVIFRETTRVPISTEDDNAPPVEDEEPLFKDLPSGLPEIEETLSQVYPPELDITLENEGVEEEFDAAVLKEASG